MGARAAALGAVLYWITNPLWLGGSLAFLATEAWSSNLTKIEAGSVWDYVFKLVFIWIGILVAIISLKRGKWIPTIGAFVKIALVAIVCVTVGIYAIEHGIHGSGSGDFSPTLAVFLGAVPLLIFAMSGFECGTAAGEEMRDAQHDVPRSIGASAIVSVGCYLLPIAAILVVMPASKVSSVAGFMDAAARSFSVYGGAQDVLVDLAALAFIFTLLTQGAAWMMGSDRVLAAVGMDGTFPRALGVISDRFGTPVRVNLISGVVATVFSIVAINLASGSAATTFEIVLTIAISTVLLSYLLIYPSAVRLRRLLPRRPPPVRGARRQRRPVDLHRARHWLHRARLVGRGLPRHAREPARCRVRLRGHVGRVARALRGADSRHARDHRRDRGRRAGARRARAPTRARSADRYAAASWRSSRSIKASPATS